MLKHIKFLSTFMKAPKKWCTVVHQLSVSCSQCSYIFVQPLRAWCIILFIMCAMLGYTGQTRLLSDQVFRRDLAAVIFCLCGCFFSLRPNKINCYTFPRRRNAKDIEELQRAQSAPGALTILQSCARIRYLAIC